MFGAQLRLGVIQRRAGRQGLNSPGGSCQQDHIGSPAQYPPSGDKLGTHSQLHRRLKARWRLKKLSCRFLQGQSHQRGCHLPPSAGAHQDCRPCFETEFESLGVVLGLVLGSDPVKGSDPVRRRIQSWSVRPSERAQAAGSRMMLG